MKDKLIKMTVQSPCNTQIQTCYVGVPNHNQIW